MAGQISGAFGSFVLQVVAARALGAAGLGTYALAFSVMVLCGAISNGLVGDSLVVLERSRPTIRAALESWSLVVGLASGFGAGVAFLVLNVTDRAGAAALCWATAIYMFRTIIRRWLMAVMRFWHLVVGDLISLMVSLAIIVSFDQVARLDVTALIFALGCGQAVGCLVNYWRLPREERYLGPLWPAELGAVFRYGGIRAVQQLVRPATLTASRSFATISAGQASYGQLEAARIYMAPAMLMVEGLGSYLFSSYANRANARGTQLLHSADRSAAAMGATTLALGAAATAVAPWASRLITGSNFDLEALAIFGWSVVAATAAATTAYGNLAAVRGGQGRVLRGTVVTDAVALVVIWVVVVSARAPLWTIPYLLAFAGIAQAVWVRMILAKAIGNKGRHRMGREAERRGEHAIR